MKPQNFFQALSDSTRLRCLLLLLEFKEVCVWELTQALDLSQPKISRHLAALRKLQLVKQRKEGSWIFYRINEKLPKWSQDILFHILKEFSQLPVHVEDKMRLKKCKTEFIH